MDSKKIQIFPSFIFFLELSTLHLPSAATYHEVVYFIPVKVQINNNSSINQSPINNHGHCQSILSMPQTIHWKAILTGGRKMSIF